MWKGLGPEKVVYLPLLISEVFSGVHSNKTIFIKILKHCMAFNLAGICTDDAKVIPDKISWHLKMIQSCSVKPVAGVFAATHSQGNKCQFRLRMSLIKQ